MLVIRNMQNKCDKISSLPLPNATVLPGKVPLKNSPPKPAMHKITFNLKICFGLAIISMLFFYFYLSSEEYINVTSFVSNKEMFNVNNPQEQTDLKTAAVEHLKDTVGTIPNFEPKQNEVCPKFPDVFNLHINNNMWQVLETTNGTFYLFGAYYDDRNKNRYGPSVRIVGMINRLDPTVPTICQFWYKDHKPLEVPVRDYLLIWRRPWGVYKSSNLLYPYLITCDVPEGYQNVTPGAVSLVEMPCALATNNLMVNNYYEPPERKKDFVVCVKGLDFPFDDRSVRLIEWIELLKLFGVDKIVFYNLQSHPKIEELLYYYQTNYSSFEVEVRRMSLPGRQLNFRFYQHFYLRQGLMQKRFNELIAYNDCFYRNMYDYKYVILLDIDEIIVPTVDGTWTDLIQRILHTTNKTYSSFSVQNVYFLDTIQDDHKTYRDIPTDLRMLQHITRTRNFTKTDYFVKCFHNTEEIVTLHNHFPLNCFTRQGNQTCEHYSVDTNVAQLNHYREDCGKIAELGKQCQEMKKDSVIDKTLWRFTDLLVARVRAVAEILRITLS